MKNLYFRTFVIVFIFLACTAIQDAAATEIRSITTDDGISTWFIESDTLPMVAARITFKKSGSAYDNDDVSGLAYLTSLLLQEGAGDMDGQEFRKKMSELAIKYDFSVDKDNFYVSFKTLNQNFDKAVELITLALTEPKFTKEAIENAKKRQIISLAKQEESPEYIARRKWDKEVFGSHPYSKPVMGRKESIANIARIHLQHFVKKHLTRSNMSLSFVGHVNETKIRQVIRQYLSDIPEEKELYPEMKVFSDFPDSQTYYIEKPLKQNVIMFGQRALDIMDKDFYPLLILNYVIGGGGFESRLMEEIREQRGLAYSVYSYIDHSPHAPTLEGVFATDYNKAQEALNVFHQEINKLKTSGITKEELELAKNYLIGSFALKVDSYERLVNYLNFMQINNLGKDFLKTRNDRVRAVKFEDVQRVTENVLSPDKMTIVVVGRKNDALPPEP